MAKAPCGLVVQMLFCQCVSACRSLWGHPYEHTTQLFQDESIQCQCWNVCLGLGGYIKHVCQLCVCVYVCVRPSVCLHDWIYWCTSLMGPYVWVWQSAPWQYTSLVSETASS